jgi:hypothetical protein
VSFVQVDIGEMAAKVLTAAGDPDPSRLSILLPRAVRFYLDERDGDHPGWGYPSFLDGKDGAAGDFQVGIEDELWQRLQAEAERQGVPPEELAQHAAFYYGAARDEGRLTERIAGELRREDEEKAEAG